MSERTLAIIKPDAVKKNAIGDIITRYDKAGLKPVAIRMMRFSKSTSVNLVMTCSWPFLARSP